MVAWGGERRGPNPSKWTMAAATACHHPPSLPLLWEGLKAAPSGPLALPRLLLLLWLLLLLRLLLRLLLLQLPFTAAAPVTPGTVPPSPTLEPWSFWRARGTCTRRY